MYAKLFSSILTSSIWSEDAETCKLWITLLALADREGYVFGSVLGLARQAALPLEAVEAGLARFMEPDPHSQDRLREGGDTKDGRRIEKTPSGAWKILNYAFYRDLADSDVRRFENREAQRRHREALKARSASVSVGHAPSSSVTSQSHTQRQSQKKNSEEREGGVAPLAPARSPSFRPPTIEEIEAYVTEKKLLPFDAVVFSDHFEAKGWITGKTRMKDWKAAVRNAHREGWTTRKGNGKPPIQIPLVGKGPERPPVALRTPGPDAPLDVLAAFAKKALRDRSESDETVQVDPWLAAEWYGPNSRANERVRLAEWMEGDDEAFERNRERR